MDVHYFCDSPYSTEKIQYKELTINDIIYGPGLNILLSNFGNIYMFFYENVKPEYIQDFLYILSIIRFEQLYDSNIKTWILGLIDILTLNPNVNSKEILKVYNNLSCYLDISRFEFFSSKIRNINNSRVSNLWDLWELGSYNYNSYIQWLPEEMVEDISILEGRLCHRNTYH